MILQKSAVTEAAEAEAGKLGVNPDRLRYLDNYLQGFVDRGEHAFVAFRVLRKGSLIFDGYYGVRTPAGDPLREDAIFPVQSTTKPYTATCCAILQEDGKIDYWDRVQKYFPGFTGEGKDGVLLWHLLCHTTGMSDDTTDAFKETYFERELGITVPEEGTDDEARLDALMEARDKMGLPKMARGQNAVNNLFFEIKLRAPLDSEPGSMFTYYGDSYKLLGMIVEQISGKSLEAFARERIFEPLGLSDTHFYLPEEKRHRFVQRDTAFKGGNFMNSEWMMTTASAAGGLKTTMADLARFGQMFLQGGTLDGKRIISPATVRLMTQDQNEKLPESSWLDRKLGANWGLGWDVKNGKKDDLGMLRSERSYNHGGYGGSRLLIDPDAELVAAIYMVEQREESFYDDIGPSVNVLYSALDQPI
jgi:CubicO group peptidase (beta-lactamase class C family)